MTHFLQSEAWQTFQTSLGREVFRRHGDGWEFMAIKERGRGNTRLYVPYGPVASSEASFKTALRALHKLGKEQNVTFIRVEPENSAFADYLKTHKWRPVDYQSLQPRITQVISLAPPEDELIANMSQSVRNLYRNFHKKDLSVHVSQNPADVELFLRFIHSVARRNDITPHSDGYFRRQADALFPIDAARLIYVNHNDTPIAAAIFYDNDTTRYYAHAAADDAFRKLSAGSVLVAFAIIDAKRRGLQEVDLYGIAPSDDPDHPWAGFTKFKKSFGGEERVFAGPWEMPLKPLAYRLYRLYQTLSRD